MAYVIDVITDQARRVSGVGGKVMSTRKGRTGLGIVLSVVIIAIFAPIIAPHDPLNQSLMHRLESPSATYPFGTDAYGRGILSRIVFGFRISLLIGVISVGIGVVIGVSLGIIGGYYGGWVDTLIGRLVDIMLSFPFLLFALFVVAILGQSLINVMIAVGLATSPRFARLARGDVLSIKEEGYVVAAQSIGRSNFKIMGEHVLLNVLTPVVVMASLNMGRAIIISAALSFLGLGVQPPTPTLGGILSSGRDYIALAPWVTIFPGIAITITVLGFNLLGDALRDAMDPQLQQGGGFT